MTRFHETDGSYRWHLSMMLYPKGRGSTEEDWKWLGRLAAYLGAPEKPLVMRENAPNAPVHWNWVDEPSTGGRPQNG